jgi:hypothetical protein
MTSNVSHKYTGFEEYVNKNIVLAERECLQTTAKLECLHGNIGDSGESEAVVEMEGRGEEDPPVGGDRKDRGVLSAGQAAEKKE